MYIETLITDVDFIEVHISHVTTASVNILRAYYYCLTLVSGINPNN